MKKIFLILIIVLFNNQNNYSQSSNDYIIKNLDSNKPYPDLGVAFFDEDFIVYSTQINNNIIKHSRSAKRRKKKKVELLPQNLEFYFAAINDEYNIVNSQRLSNRINSDFDDKSLVFSKDNSIVYFSRESIVANSSKKHSELFKADVISPGSWMNIKKLSISDPVFSVSNPCLSDDGKELYYVSNKEGDFNIYKVKIADDGDFGTPEKLSSKINTSFDEKTPFIHNNILYFSSNRPGGLGNLDIYSIKLEGNNKVKRLEKPFNSSFDDLYYVLNKDNNGFFVSNRPGGKGKEDIYSFRLKDTFKEENDVVEANNTPKKDFKKTIIKEDTTDEVIVKKTNDEGVKKDLLNVNSDKNQTNSNNEYVTDTVVEIVKNENIYDFQRRYSYYQEAENQQTKVNGKIIKDKYSKCQNMFDKLGNVYFDYSESYIREDAAIELDKVIRVMRLCPKIKVIAASHTDSRASKKYNLELSQKRSTSVINYILNNANFSNDRIIGVGYGEERLINECSDGVKCTEYKHQLNRRTHFEIRNY